MNLDRHHSQRHLADTLFAIAKKRTWHRGAAASIDVSESHDPLTAALRLYVWLQDERQHPLRTDLHLAQKADLYVAYSLLIPHATPFQMEVEVRTRHGRIVLTDDATSYGIWKTQFYVNPPRHPQFIEDPLGLGCDADQTVVRRVITGIEHVVTLWKIHYVEHPVHLELPVPWI